MGLTTLRSLRLCGFAALRLCVRSLNGKAGLKHASDKVPGYFTVLAGARLPDTLDLTP